MLAEIASAGMGGGAAPVAAAAPAAPVAAAAPSGGAGISNERATQCVIRVLAEKTGYEEDMIEMDMALETELGVDSIKRVEILSDVQKELGVEAKDVAALSRTQTVGEVVDAMLAEIASAGMGGGAAPVAAAAPAAPVAAAAPSGGAGISNERATNCV